jgi:hypothetical protein
MSQRDESNIGTLLVDRCRELAREVDPKGNVITVSGNVLEYDDPMIGRVRLIFQPLELSDETVSSSDQGGPMPRAKWYVVQMDQDPKTRHSRRRLSKRGYATSESASKAGRKWANAGRGRSWGVQEGRR